MLDGFVLALLGKSLYRLDNRQSSHRARPRKFTGAGRVASPLQTSGRRRALAGATTALLPRYAAKLVLPSRVVRAPCTATSASATVFTSSAVSALHSNSLK